MHTGKQSVCADPEAAGVADVVIVACQYQFMPGCDQQIAHVNAVHKVKPTCKEEHSDRKVCTGQVCKEGDVQDLFGAMAWEEWLQRSVKGSIAKSGSCPKHLDKTCIRPTPPLRRLILSRLMLTSNMGLSKEPMQWFVRLAVQGDQT